MSLLAWYPFTKDTKNKGLSSDATFNGTINFLPSQFGYGLDLSKGNNVTISELAELKTFSIAFWVKINSDSSLSTNWVNIFSIWDNNSENSDSGSLRWQTGYGDPYATTMGIGGPYNSSEQNICANMGIMTSEKNVWYHICVVVDYENNRVASYLNGTVKNTTTHNGGHIWTGHMGFGSTNTRGVMNDFRIYNHALSTKEIKELAKGLILHYDLKGDNTNSGTYLYDDVTEYDLSGNGYNGTKQGITYSTDTPKYNLSSEFDTNKNLVFTDNRIYHNGDEVSNLSVSIWFNYTTMSNFWNLNQNGFWRIRPASNTKLQSLIYMGTALQDVRTELGQTIKSNTWYHLVMTFGNGIIKNYFNGELTDTIDKSDVATVIKCTGTNRWSLGDYAEGSETMTGKLSDFRIYATTLSADDVKALYNIGAQIDNSGKLYCGALVEE